MPDIDRPERGVAPAVAAINRWLDLLPRTHFDLAGRELPAFRTCGIAGFYVAVLVEFAAGLLTRKSPLLLGGLACCCAASFFAVDWISKRLRGRETIVLLEHVWVALGICAGALTLARAPVLAYLDVVCVALCPFLAAGRLGCTFVGCCHGLPCRFGIRYPAALVYGGFDPVFADLRLFPAPAVEFLALLSIGLIGTVLLFTGTPGLVLVWFLVSYAVVRFGLEGIRGDVRPEWLGLSVPRWMCVIQTGFALNLVAPLIPAVNAVLFCTLAASLAWRRFAGLRRHLLAPQHLAEIADILTHPHAKLEMYRTSRDVLLSVSPAYVDRGLQVALSVAGERRDLMLLCEIAVAAIPRLDSSLARYAAGPALHITIPPDGGTELVTARALYTAVLRRWLHPETANAHRSRPPWYFNVTSGPAR